MPITNKDGTPYKLRRPNKLTMEQVVWGPEDKIILHNCHWKGKKAEKEVEPVVIKPKLEPVVEQPKIAVEEEMPELSSPTPVQEESKPKSKINTQNIVLFYCQPVVMREAKDDLYGDTYKRVDKGKKFTFEGLVVDNMDIAMTFWTNVEIPKNSVVFPARYRSGQKYGEYRWWKIVDSQPKSNGFIVKTVPSDYTPSFAD